MDPSRADRLQWLLEERCSTRAPYDPSRLVTSKELALVLDAARWAPTAHNMQNFMLVVVDDPNVLAALGTVRSAISPTFITENYLQLSFTPEQLKARRTGILGTQFPSSWCTDNPDAAPKDASRALSEVIAGAPTIILVLFDPTHRAPASEHDALGMISIGCVLENMWLAASAAGLDVQIASAFAGEATEAEVARILEIPPPWRTALALRLGHAIEPVRQLRVRRLAEQFVHYNRFNSNVPPTDA
jgi:nitroreductase